MVCQDGGVCVGNVGGLDAPLFGIQVVGTATDVLHGAQRMSVEADCHDAPRGVRRQNQGFAPQELQRLLVVQVYVGELSFRTSRNLVGSEP